MKRYTYLILALVAMFVVACSSEGSGASATQTASATAADDADSEETPAPDGADPTLEPGAGDLAGILPTEVGGIAIQYESASGADVMGAEGVDEEAQEFFDRVGAEPSDLSSAFGFGVDSESGSGITIFAFRVAGADEGTLRDEFRATVEEDESQTLTEENVEGKNVLMLSSDDEFSGYVYVKNDIVFVIGGQPMDLADEALSQLP